MKETVKKTGGLLGALARAQHAVAQARGTALTLVENEGLSREGAQLVREHAIAQGETDTLKELEALEEAREDLRTDPMVRRAWLEERIMQQDGNIDPAVWLHLLLGGMASKMPAPRGSTELRKDALPLFVSNHNDDGFRRNVIIIPRMRRDDYGVMSTHGVSRIRATSREYEAAYLKLEALRPFAREKLLTNLESDTLVDLREAVRLGLHLLPFGSIYTPEKLKEYFEQTDAPDAVKNKQNDRTYLKLKISDKEVYVVQESPESRRLISRLEKLQGYGEAFQAGGSNVEADIAEALTVETDSVINAEEFARGTAGIVGVHHKSWRVKGESHEVMALFERRQDDLWWRWRLANPAAVEHLFGGQGRLQFHTWSDKPVPVYLKRLMLEGEVKPTTN